MISPSPRAIVCRVGDRLEVVCNITETILSWNVMFVGTNDRIERTVTSTQLVQEVVTINSSVFLFSRTSERGIRLPLMSTLVIGSVSSSLNGSNITCMESSSTLASMTTTVYIIGDNDGGLMIHELC